MIDSGAILSASSLILMRDRLGAAPEILFVRRSDALAFAPGAYVFPGGRIDPADRASAEDRATTDVDDMAARIAAVRETGEETGIVDAADPADLTLFARWLPPASAPRRFDTRFYLAPARADAAEPTADGTESSAAFWATAQDVLEECSAGRGRIIFPTRRLLERLAQFDRFAQARDQALGLPERTIAPWIEERADGAWLCIPADAGYPVTEERMASASRL